MFSLLWSFITTSDNSSSSSQPNTTTATSSLSFCSAVSFWLVMSRGCRNNPSLAEVRRGSGGSSSSTHCSHLSGEFCCALPCCTTAAEAMFAVREAVPTLLRPKSTMSLFYIFSASSRQGTVELNVELKTDHLVKRHNKAAQLCK